jgi:hypothetical protein
VIAAQHAHEIAVGLVVGAAEQAQEARTAAVGPLAIHSIGPTSASSTSASGGGLGALARSAASSRRTRSASSGSRRRRNTSRTSSALVFQWK